MKPNPKKAASRTVLIEGIPDVSDVKLVAWWYGGLKKNPSAPSEPKVEVCFRSILEDGSYGGYWYYDVGLTNLGQVRLGTIWHHREKIGEIPMVEETFQLNFSDDGWSSGGPWDKSTNPKALGYLITKSYPLPEVTRHPKTRVLHFHLSDNPSGLVVPCMEVFSRLYGRSQYVKRTLVTQPFNSAFDNLVVPDVEAVPSNVWQVTVDKHCVDGDGIFLAHLKHDEVTKRRVRDIWAQCEAVQDVLGSAHAFPKVPPWFQGAAQLLVKGVWLDPGKRRFLALQITGCSDPGGVEIYLDRANTNITGPLKKIKGGTSWPRIREVQSRSDTSIQITHIQEPSAGHVTEEVDDDGFVRLGRERKISRVQRQTTAARGQPTLVEKSPGKTVSGGAVFGDREGVAPGSIAAPEIASVDHTLMATWEALVAMVKDKKSPVLEVAAVTANGDLVTAGPVIIGFPNPKEENSSLSDRAKFWVYLNHRAKTHVRGVMLVQVKTDFGAGYIMEVQKRPPRTDDDKLQSSGAYKYLAFSVEAADMQPGKWINRLVLATANALGVVSKVGKECPGPFFSFKHFSDVRGGIKASILDGLKGIGLI